MSKLSEGCRFFTLKWGCLLASGLLVAFLAALAVPNYVGPRTSKTNAIESNQ
jgi:hypothetical protein